MADRPTPIPGEHQIEMTMTITMKLDEWKKLKEQIGEQWPGWQLASKINELVIPAHTHFTAKDEA